MKDVGLRIRVQRGLRDKFMEVCRAQDKPAAQVLREFMREYVARQAHEGPEPQQSGNARREGKRESQSDICRGGEHGEC